MKIKKEILILIGIIVVLGVYLAQRKTDRTHYTLPAQAKVAGAKVDKIEISRAGASLALNKKDDQWFIAPDDKLADKSKVTGMVDALADFQITALVSEAASYSRYELDDQAKIVLKAWQGDKVAREFELGKAASTFQHTFVKLPEDPNVYHAGGHLRPKFEFDADELRDLGVMRVNVDQIDALTLTLGEDSATFKKRTPVAADAPAEDKETPEEEPQETPEPEGKAEETQPEAPQWINTTTDQPATAAMITELLEELSDLECSRYLKDRTVADLEDQTPRLKLEFKGGKTEALMIFAPENDDSEEYPGTSSQNEDAFVLAKWKYENLEEKIKALVNPEPKPEATPEEPSAPKAS